PRPADYKSAALPAELHQRLLIFLLATNIYYHIGRDLSSVFLKKFRCFILYAYFPVIFSAWKKRRSGFSKKPTPCIACCGGVLR
ncbi:MAG: hypothetical protein NC203_02635, partial [Firmicutes bacterium]|nr:hypothetical protein [Bacillota bacterium]